MTYEVRSKRQGAADQLSFVMAGAVLCWQDVIDSWSNEPDFAEFFSAALAASSHRGFRWETPPLRTAALRDPFECVVVEDNSLDRPEDRSAFGSKFQPGTHAVVFDSLGGDATLIAPTPRPDEPNDATVYTHLASFVRTASPAQLFGFWQAVGSALPSHISDTPRWLSTAGGGVAWLHARIDSVPKYYAHRPYVIVG